MTFVLRAGLVIGVIFYLSPLRHAGPGPAPGPGLAALAEPLREHALRAGAAEAGRAAEASLRGTLGLDAPARHPDTTAAIR
ncbi:hypothetical protein [Methylobacterium oryzihabitans]|uniref:Uncharacterized protein n=1 Tax=Methylobacterium oryzihabitans TaxID=2499852 RepID=A0A437PFD3_9HYPH|nr:hypothetical protein [Methylobacterium oryzihabitans]RVU20998.1 hypothetical protein EOE48_02565 [Methylobacterium oryzihabitans]